MVVNIRLAMASHTLDAVQISWCGVNVSTFILKPVRLKHTVMPFTDIV